MAFAVLVCDQLSKAWVMAALAPDDPARYFLAGPLRRIAVLEPFFFLEFAANTGAAFSLFQNHPEVLTVVASLLALGVLAWGTLGLERGDHLGRVAVALIFGGAVGNLVDRFRYGFVVDFILVYYWKGHPWPKFNVADSAICVGIALFLLGSWFEGRRPHSAQRPLQTIPHQTPRP